MVNLVRNKQTTTKNDSTLWCPEQRLWRRLIVLSCCSMELVWHGEFNNLFSQYMPDAWTLIPTSQAPSTRWHVYRDSAKVRFCCQVGLTLTLMSFARWHSCASPFKARCQLLGFIFYFVLRSYDDSLHAECLLPASLCLVTTLSLEQYLQFERLRATSWQMVK